MSTVVDFYNKYDEDIRLSTNKARKTEFNVTTSVLNAYIKRDDRILEIGAGTGIYSFYYACKGNEVLATDITPKHVEIMKEKLGKFDNINFKAEIANATDLTQYESESFDIVLCLGPMYHLTNEEDRKRCMAESLRLLKKGGLLAVAYINKHYILNAVMLGDKKFMTNSFVDKILNTGVIKEGEKECFWTDAFFTTPKEMETLVSNFNTEVIDHVATDGMSPFFKSYIDNMTEEEYNTWMYYNLLSCREKSILGMSNHGLIICRK